MNENTFMARMNARKDYQMHASITLERVVKMVKKAQRDMDYYPGICKACGKSANNCEGDAEGYTCNKCGAQQVMGAENLLMELA
jgi:tRNA(Ile2) C34 agmatinyltransferase TiaS